MAPLSVNKLPTPRQLRDAYARGENITQLLRQAAGPSSSEEIIEIAYDLQAGSYISGLADPKAGEHKDRYCTRIGREIRSLVGQPRNLLEAGVGEATTLSRVLKSLDQDPLSAYGFDISWSRILHGRQWLASEGLAGVHLCTGSLFEIPYRDNAFDVVYTSHSIEPNGGNEIPILQELYRVTARYLLLLEPGYEIACEEGRQRMQMHGYCTGLEEKCRQLGYEVLETRPFEECVNSLNPTMLITIRKTDVPPSGDEPPYACPLFKNELRESNGVMFSPGGLHVYPIIGGIPCLRASNAVVASHFQAEP